MILKKKNDMKIKRKISLWIIESKYTTGKELRKMYKENGEDPNDYDIEEFSEVEISVARKNNKHTIESYGWPGLDKIILFGNDDYVKKDIKWCEQVAKVICDALNKKGL